MHPNGRHEADHGSLERDDPVGRSCSMPQPLLSRRPAPCNHRALPAGVCSLEPGGLAAHSCSTPSPGEITVATRPRDPEEKKTRERNTNCPKRYPTTNNQSHHPPLPSPVTAIARRHHHKNTKPSNICTKSALLPLSPNILASRSSFRASLCFSLLPASPPLLRLRSRYTPAPPRSTSSLNFSILPPSPLPASPLEQCVYWVTKPPPSSTVVTPIQPGNTLCT
eukprot:gb/GEZN01009766.1/.p1 GENE.gb/GEZN01009766.1/~~gb/GEZN01009766.1/.p1  ORF type:complete len:223 (-),score=17.23 gb/GEZN01009766.1/:189-857(-)